jgi:L-fuculose-phosphate aldolase
VLDAERTALAAACGRLAAEGLVIGTSGNVSVKSGDHVAVTPTGGVFSELAADDMAVMTLDGVQVHGPHAPTSETALHLALYERLGAGAVVHTHAPTATALSCVVDEVPTVHYGMLMFGGSLRVAPYATFGTPELAENVAAALEGRTAALMQNHGAIAIGHDLDFAVEVALMTEWACRVFWTAKTVGEPKVLTEDEMQEVAVMVQKLNYGQKSDAA